MPLKSKEEDKNYFDRFIIKYGKIDY